MTTTGAARPTQDNTDTDATEAAKRSFDVIPVGREAALEPMAMRRTAAQRATVLRFVNHESFAYAMGNPFTEAVSPNYEGPFTFLYRDVDGGMHGVRIGKRGNILRHAVV